MANYNQSVLTTAGLALANRAAKGLAKFKITRVTSTADVVGSSDIPELAKLPSEVQVGSITGQQPLADGDETVIGTKVLFTNHNLQTSYKINAVGLYATEDGKAEILYSVITAIEPEFMPDYGDQVLMEFGMTIYVVVGQVDNMSIIVNPDSFATVAYVDKAIDDHQVVFPETLTYRDHNEVVTGKWTFKGGATDGKGNAYATTKDVATDLNNGLSTKVTDNKDGTIQVNGIQVNPYNKLTDTIGGRNYLLNSDQPITISEANNRYVIIPTKLKTLSAGNYIFTADVSGLVGNQTSLTIGLSNPSNHNDYIVSDVPIINGTVTKKMAITDGDIHTNVIIYSGSNGWTGSAGCTAVYSYYQFIKSDVVKDWTPAPEDKVNITDMRKPASDVAGIEEVNAKQDKLDYTPADDSKVVHDNGDGTVTVDGQTYTPMQADTNGNITKVHNLTNGVKINGHLIDIDPTNGLTIDGTPLINVVADEATAKAKSANDKLHVWVTKE